MRPASRLIGSDGEAALLGFGAGAMTLPGSSVMVDRRLISEAVSCTRLLSTVCWACR